MRDATEVLNNLSRRIECPVPWCRGDWEQHGGYGIPPEEWMHESKTTVPVAGAGRLSRVRIGTDPDVWTLLAENNAAIEAEGLPALAAKLRQ